MVKQQRQPVGLTRGRRTMVALVFELVTPKDHVDPATDEVLLLDTLDHVRRHVMEFHDVPGFKLIKYTADGRRIV